MMLTRVLPRRSSFGAARVRVTVTCSTSGAKTRVTRHPAVADAALRGAVARIVEDERDFDLDLPSRHDRQLDGGRRLRRATRGALRVLDMKFELALDHGPARAERIEEGDVLERVLRVSRGRDDDQRQHE